MSKIKEYASTIYDAGDGVADFEQMEFEMAYKQYEYGQLKEELGNE